MANSGGLTPEETTGGEGIWTGDNNLDTTMLAVKC